LPALEIREVLLLTFRQVAGLCLELLHHALELSRIRLQGVGLVQQLISFLRRESQRARSEECAP